MTSTPSWRTALTCCVLIVSMAACGKKGGDPPSRDTSTSPQGTTTAPTDTTGTAAAPRDTAPLPTPDNTWTDATIAAKLAWADSMEIEMSKVAQKQGKSAGVKAYAKMMIDHHTMMMKEGREAAQKAGITPAPPAGDPDMAAAPAKMAKLQGATGAAFDSLYVACAVEDHQKVLDFITSALGMAQKPELKAHLEKGRPVVQKHLDEARAMQGRMSGKTM